MNDPDMTTSRVEDLRRAGQRMFAGGLGGLLSGLVVGGIGGRLVMLMLRLTSGPEVIGVESDDGFRIGAFTGSTIFLLGLTAVSGAVLGVLYVLLRRYFPERFRALLVGGFLGVVGGAAIVEPEGVDFTLLEPRWLAIASFVLLPALFGFTLSKFVDRLLELRIRFGLAWVALLAAAAVLFLIGTEGGTSLALSLTLIAVFLFGWLAGGKVPALRRIPSSAPVVWLARTLMLAGAVFAAAALVKDVGAIL